MAAPFVSVVIPVLRDTPMLETQLERLGCRAVPATTKSLWLTAIPRIPVSATHDGHFPKCGGCKVGPAVASR